ncbi:MAG: PEP-CTERM sorting domain-containing protein [Gammaproteobacteria bacterium]
MQHPRHTPTLAAPIAVLLALGVLFSTPRALAGPFAPAAGQPGSTAVAKTSSAFAGWATAVADYQPGATVANEWRTPARALGPAVGDAFDIVSLGNQGRITLTFGGTLYDGPGWDFAVFENSINASFLELAFVEVSSNGSTFVRFPAFSLTPAPVGGFGSLDPTNVDGLAGKYQQGYGTPFDLGLFAGANIPGFDRNAVTHVRLVDVKGDGSERDNWPASVGGPNPIYDVYPTVGSVGFDLDAVGVRYLEAAPPPAPVPLPGTALLVLAPLALLRRRC